MKKNCVICFVVWFIISGCRTDDATHLSSSEFVSISAVAESRPHKKDYSITQDGKVWMTYSVEKYDSATGKTHWQSTKYWTREKDLPKHALESIRLQVQNTPHGATEGEAK